MRRFTLACVALLLCALCGPAFSAVDVGAKPTLKFESATGGKVDLAALEGKLVLVDFWATWCGPCMAEAGHMVEIHKDYGPKGLVVIGISLDNDKGKMLQVAQQSGFAWPQFFDGGGWKTKVAVEWGVNSIPATFLISPEGEVIWKGHPANINAALADAFQKHPPRLLDPKVLAEATANLGKVETALKDSDKAAAAKAFAKIPADAHKEKTLAPRIEAVAKQLEEYANGLLEEANKLADDKQFTAAIPKLRDISKMTGLAASKIATDKLTELQANPEVKAQIAAAEKAEKEKERADRAAGALAIAEKFQGEKKDDQAYAQYQSVAKLYEGTDSAAKAASALKTYEKDVAFMKAMKNKAATSQAKSAMTLAESYRAAGRTDLARKKYQQIIDQFAGTDIAEDAKKALEALPE